MRRIAWAVSLLGLLVVAPAVAHAQQDAAVQLRRNYPNPFNPETTIPFALSPGLWDDGVAPVVTMRIYNILAQLVAVPILQQSGEDLENVSITWNGTGEYSAYWDGKIRNTNREAASGVYIYQLIVDGKVYQKKMTIVK
jgi:hypothetical protein